MRPAPRLGSPPPRFQQLNLDLGRLSRIPEEQVESDHSAPGDQIQINIPNQEIRQARRSASVSGGYMRNQVQVIDRGPQSPQYQPLRNPGRQLPIRAPAEAFPTLRLNMSGTQRRGWENQQQALQNQPQRQQEISSDSDSDEFSDSVESQEEELEIVQAEGEQDANDSSDDLLVEEEEEDFDLHFRSSGEEFQYLVGRERPFRFMRGMRGGRQETSSSTAARSQIHRPASRLLGLRASRLDNRLAGLRRTASRANLYRAPIAQSLLGQRRRRALRREEFILPSQYMQSYPYIREELRSIFEERKQSIPDNQELRISDSEYELQQNDPDCEIEREININDYDKDYSEVEDLIQGIADEGGDDVSSSEEQGLTQLLTEFGTIGLVLYHRLKQEKYLKDYLLQPLNQSFEAEDQLSCESIKILIKDVMQLVMESLKMLQDPKSEFSDEKSSIINPIGFLNQILCLIPNTRKLQKTIDKRLGQQDSTDHQAKESQIQEIALIKILIDIKMTILQKTEAPKFKELKNEILPLAMELHKRASTSVTQLISRVLKTIPQWRLLVPHVDVDESGILIIKDTRKAYLNFYKRRIQQYENIQISNNHYKSKKTAKQMLQDQVQDESSDLYTIL